MLALFDAWCQNDASCKSVWWFPKWFKCVEMLRFFPRGWNSKLDPPRFTSKRLFDCKSKFKSKSKWYMYGCLRNPCAAWAIMFRCTPAQAITRRMLRFTHGGSLSSATSSCSSTLSLASVHYVCLPVCLASASAYIVMQQSFRNGIVSSHSDLLADLWITVANKYSRRAHSWKYIYILVANIGLNLLTDVG